jgi:hypothetical protein
MFPIDPLFISGKSTLFSKEMSVVSNFGTNYEHASLEFASGSHSRFVAENVMMHYHE